MRAVKAQYFLSYAVQGCLLPYISVYFKQQGLNETQIGYILAASSLAVVLSPVLVTLLADMRIDARRVMSGMFILSALTLLGMRGVEGFGLILGVWCLHSFCYQPITPLQDGVNFCIQRRRHQLGYHSVPYHRIRVWGTIGYMCGALVLFLLLWDGLTVNAAIVAAATCALLGATNSLLLPDPQIRHRADPASAMPAAARIPTLAAAATFLRRPILIFCIATFLMTMAATAYSAFYPIYLNETVGLSKRFIAPITSVGVLVEVFFVLSFGRLSRLLGLRLLMIVSVLSIVLRMGLLFAWPSVAIGVGTQLLHGLTVIALGIIPPIFINQHADDRWRNSMQGLYTMLVLGTARIFGNLAAGPIARANLRGVFAYAAALTLLSAGLCYFAFARSTQPRAAQPATA